MTPIERLIKFLDLMGINDNQFKEKTGISNGWIGTARDNPKRSMTEPTFKRIFEGYPELSESWLKAGQGEMLKKDNVKVSAAENSAINIEEILKENAELKKEKALLMELIEFYKRK